MAGPSSPRLITRNLSNSLLNEPVSDDSSEANSDNDSDNDGDNDGDTSILPSIETAVGPVWNRRDTVASPPRTRKKLKLKVRPKNDPPEQVRLWSREDDSFSVTLSRTLLDQKAPTFMVDYGVGTEIRLDKSAAVLEAFVYWVTQEDVDHPVDFQMCLDACLWAEVIEMKDWQFCLLSGLAVSFQDEPFEVADETIHVMYSAPRLAEYNHLRLIVGAAALLQQLVDPSSPLESKFPLCANRRWAPPHFCNDFKRARFLYCLWLKKAAQTPACSARTGQPGDVGLPTFMEWLAEEIL